MTFILRILYFLDIIRKSYPGCYYCDPEFLRISRLIFRYKPITGKRKDNIKTYCGNWHRIKLIRWDVYWLISDKKPKNKKTGFIFP